MARNNRHQWSLTAKLRGLFSRSASIRICAQGHNPNQRRLRLEPLEDRRLLAVVTVTTLSDTVDFNDGVTSLREAIFATNLVGGADTINFAPSLTAGGPATITLTQGELKITDDLTITGSGANLLTIDASGNDPTPTVNNGDGSRVFEIDDGTIALKTVFISGLTLTGGDVTGVSTPSGGGAIRTFENLTVTACTISGNSASYGGGILNGSGTLLVADSTITANLARQGVNSPGQGGGIYNNGALTLTASSISGNSAAGGGAIWTTYGTLVQVTDSTLSGNSATTGYGGAIFSNHSTVTLTRSTLSGNSANGTGGAINMDEGSLLVTLSTISDNSARGNGGGGISISSTSSLTVTGSTISGNSAPRTSFPAHGGGIRITGSTAVTITGSTISDNSASGNGGGIWQRYGSLALVDSALTRNSAGNGGGLWTSVDVTATRSKIADNSARFFGGAIYSSLYFDSFFRTFYGGNLTINGSTIRGNSAGTSGGGIVSFGNVVANDSTIASNVATLDGGAVSNQGTVEFDGSRFGGNVTLSDSTISDNSSGHNGGGIGALGSFGEVTVTNSTLSGNSASGNGGGIYANSGVAVKTTNTTISGNSAGVDGGGIRKLDLAAVLNHTIVAGNTRGVNEANDVTGSLAAAFSLLGVDTGATITDNGGNLIGTAAAPIDPLLGPLADNGGPTMTHALLPGSPAIDAGDPAAVAGVSGVPPFDQRDEPFTRVYGVGIDIGAFELQPIPPTIFGDYNQNGEVDAADYVVWRKSLGSTGVPAFSGADGNGDTTIDQDDLAVWRRHFGQTIPPTGAGSGLSITAASAAQAAPARESTGQETLRSLYVGDPNRAMSPRETSGAGQAAIQREIRPLSFVPLPSLFAPYRSVTRASLDAQQTIAASRRDEALVAWLATHPDTKKHFEDARAAETWTREGGSNTAEPQMESVEQVFAQLASN